MEFGVLSILGIWSLWFRNFGGLGFWSFEVPAEAAAVASDAPPVAAEQAPADVVHSQGQEAVSVASGVSPVPDSLAPAAAAAAVATAADALAPVALSVHHSYGIAAQLVVSAACPVPAFATTTSDCVAAHAVFVSVPPPPSEGVVAC